MENHPTKNLWFNEENPVTPSSQGRNDAVLA